MSHFRLCGLGLMVLLITACAALGEAPPTETLPPPVATQPLSSEFTPTPTPMPSPTTVPDTETPLPGNRSEYAPQPGDSALMLGEAFVEDSGILTLESFPPQFKLSLSGSLPTPCHQLRVAFSPPDAKHQIMVEVYTVVNPDLMCMQVLAPFSATVPLEGYAVGPTYSVIVNGAVVGEFP